MNKKLDQYKCLASLAVFREMYNSKTDIYFIISQFIKEVILNYSLYKFSLNEIANKVNTEYGVTSPNIMPNPTWLNGQTSPDMV